MGTPSAAFRSAGAPRFHDAGSRESFGVGESLTETDGKGIPFWVSAFLGWKSDLENGRFWAPSPNPA